MTGRNEEGPRSPQSTIELLWGLREPASRGPKATLSADRIARAAIAVADADGIAAVSMQRVAAELDFTKMSLYRHVAGKAELFAVMIDTAIGSPPDLASDSNGWRPQLEKWAKLMWANWRRHPWLPEASQWQRNPHLPGTGAARVIGPNEAGWVERAVAALNGTGLTNAEQLDAVFLISGHIRNTHAMTPGGVLPWNSATANGLAGELTRSHGEDYPTLSASPAIDPVASRKFGLAIILDGLELRIQQRNARA